ncbi:hypothetical protein BDR06DRAFT_951962 [Suillus hirtellus]|nr:hypothetical protein BDR06DRAFT_951962 [Suillus hirtellus]
MARWQASKRAALLVYSCRRKTQASPISRSSIPAARSGGQQPNLLVSQFTAHRKSFDSLCLCLLRWYTIAAASTYLIDHRSSPVFSSTDVKLESV